MYESKRDLVVVELSLLILVFLIWGVRQLMVVESFLKFDNENLSFFGQNDTVQPKVVDTLELEWTEGKKIFQMQCQSCHLPNYNMIGPDLIEAISDYTSLEILDYLRRDKSIEQQNSKNAQCNTFPQLEIEDAEKLKLYLEEYSKFTLKNQPAIKSSY
jgi:mono/diheme cytochrome c family protein